MKHATQRVWGGIVLENAWEMVQNGLKFRTGSARVHDISAGSVVVYRACKTRIGFLLFFKHRIAGTNQHSTSMGNK